MRIGYQNAADPGDYAAIILAAGRSSRMGSFKPLLPVDGRTALAGLVESVRGAGLSDILLTTGFSREELAPAVSELRLAEVCNEDFDRGMFSSIQRGLSEAVRRWPEKKGYLLIPVDCPLISIETLKAVMEAHASGSGAPGPASFYVPVFEGKKGHPLLIPRERAEDILNYDGGGGLKGVTDRDPEGMIRVSVSDEGCLLDMDTPEGYEEVKAFAEAGFRREKLSVLSGRKRVIFLRHGETEQHEGPVFIGQYDVPLSDEGRAQAESAAGEIAGLLEEDVNAAANWVEGVSFGREPLPAVENIYCSDLARARETAEAVAREVSERYGELGIRPRVIPMTELREISLGEWDGRPVEEIRKEFPEEYERRGRDRFTFKTGNRAENFYDMQYRAVKGLRRILSEDYGRNIIIVAHSGVIRALENNLKGLRVDDDWTPLEKGGIRVWTSPPVR